MGVKNLVFLLAQQLNCCANRKEDKVIVA